MERKGKDKGREKERQGEERKRGRRGKRMEKRKGESFHPLNHTQTATNSWR